MLVRERPWMRSQPRPARCAILVPTVVVSVGLVLAAFGVQVAAQVGWRELSVTNAPPDFALGWSSTYDARANRFIFFGPDRAYEEFETWSYDLANNTWLNLTSAGFPSIEDGLMAYDSHGDRVVLHGGYRLVSPTRLVPTNETWSYDYNMDTWTNLSPSGRPTNVVGGAEAYDSLANRVVLFGGDMGGFAYMNATWVYDPTNESWTELHPIGAPPRDYGASLVFDSAADRFLLYGGLTYNEENCPSAPGCTGSSVANTMWSFDLGTDRWNALPAGPSPYHSVAGLAPRFAYDDHLDRVLLVGRWTPPWTNASWNDTWAFDLSTLMWTNVTSAGGPVPGPNGFLFYDNKLGCSVLIVDAGAWGYVCGPDSAPLGLTLWTLGFGAASVAVVGVVLFVRRFHAPRRPDTHRVSREFEGQASEEESLARHR